MHVADATNDKLLDVRLSCKTIGAVDFKTFLFTFKCVMTLHAKEIIALGWFEFSRREKIGDRKMSVNQILRQNYGSVKGSRSILGHSCNTSNPDRPCYET